jgi:hypothetical protein
MADHRLHKLYNEFTFSARKTNRYRPLCRRRRRRRPRPPPGGDGGGAALRPAKDVPAGAAAAAADLPPPVEHPDDDRAALLGRVVQLRTSLPPPQPPPQLQPGVQQRESDEGGQLRQDRLRQLHRLLRQQRQLQESGPAPERLRLRAAVKAPHQTAPPKKYIVTSYYQLSPIISIIIIIKIIRVLFLFICERGEMNKRNYIFFVSFICESRRETERRLVESLVLQN